MPNCFSRLFSKPPIKPAEPNRPPKTFVCGLLANCVDGPAGGQITEDYIRWYLKLSDDPQYDTEHSSWLATRPFNYTIADEEKGSSLTVSPNPFIDCPPATAITTFRNRLQNIITYHVRKQDTLYIVLMGLETDPTRIFIPIPEDSHLRDLRAEPHSTMLEMDLLQLKLTGFPHCHTIAIVSSSFAQHFNLRTVFSTLSAENPPCLYHSTPFTGSFLTQPSSQEVDTALSDRYTQILYNPQPCSDVASPNDATIQEYYEEIRRLRASNRIWGYPLGQTFEFRLFLYASRQMNMEQEARFRVVLMELDRERVAYRRMAEDLGLWTAPAEGEDMSPYDKWMIPEVVHRMQSPAIEMRALGLATNAISLRTSAFPSYLDVQLWLEQRWVACGKPAISKKKWEAAANRAANSMKYVDVDIPFSLAR